MKPAILFIIFLLAAAAFSQPVITDEGLLFTYTDPRAEVVQLAGDFNNWDPLNGPMVREADSLWTITVRLEPGHYQYRFVVDGHWTHDPFNHATVLNAYGEPNSVFHLKLDGTVAYAAYEPGGVELTSDEYLSSGGTLYLAVIWHQHQPNYVDASRDRLIGPWVRTHATKDYYDMTSMLEKYPNVHVAVNLTPVLLMQIEEYYLNRLRPYYHAQSNRILADAFLERWKGHTDPWIDLLLTPASEFGAEEDYFLYGGDWNCFGISHVQMARFPEYKALQDKPRDDFTLQDKLNLKCWFYLAHFDPAFFWGAVQLATGETVDLRDMIEETSPGVFERGRSFSEDDANRLVAESIKVIKAILPLHRQMIYHPDSHQGQIEVTTTPFYHPILPLIFDSRTGDTQGNAYPYFRRPRDAQIHVRQAAESYQKWFGQQVYGMWPGEGSVSQDVIPYYAQSGVKWIASGDGVLSKSTPKEMTLYRPYRCQGPDGSEVAVFFRHTALSDYIGFKYQAYDGEEAADDLMRKILSHCPAEGEERLLTIILDGENAWEWYRKDMDAKNFLSTFYRKLEALYQTRQVVTVTPIEYIEGNPERGVPSHPIASLSIIDKLHPGSWIYADFSTWIGETEENVAWQWLTRVRKDLERTAGAYENLADNPSHRQQLLELAWQEMFSAEGSDWFWWYGDDQNAPGGDRRFDYLFRGHLSQVYHYLNEAGYNLEAPEIPIILLNPEEEGMDQAATQRGE
jgi:alpha-amylase/alpha-mannosidase (GH57 family)